MTAPSGPAAVGAPGSAAPHSTCHVMFAFEVGFAVDLRRAEAALRGGAAAREPLGGGPRNPGGADFQPQPVRAMQPCPDVQVAGWSALPECTVLVFDFGALSVRFRFPLDGSLEDHVRLARALMGNAALLAHARQAAGEVLQRILPAVTKPRLGQQVEDYVVFALPSSVQAEWLLHQQRPLVARLLRAEEGALSDQETQDAFAQTVRYAPSDLAVVDWNAALLVDDDPDAALAVLEYANVELLEMRHLDDELDASLAQAYELSAQHFRRRSVFMGRTRRDAVRLAELQIDAATLFEAVNNALKLLGDQYLARVHQAAARRFHTEDYERSVLRKIETLKTIYDKIRDQQVNLRAEILEWIIIALIAIEIVLSLLRR